MGFFATLKKNWGLIRRARPGERFQSYHDRMQQRRSEHPVRGILMLTLGVLLVAAGIFLWLTPVLPGFFLSIVGLGILAVRVPGMARLLDRFELWLRRMWRRVRGRK